MRRDGEDSPAAKRIRSRGQRRIAALLRRPEIRVLGARARLRQQRVWIVGGALRDLLLGRTVLDVDLAVSGDAEPLARALERRGFGTAVALSGADPRVFRVAGRRELDIAELAGTGIRQDLARRDFTVNAMALEVGPRGWLDPFGGVADLARKRLHLLARRNLAEDPLRTLRAARLAATHGLWPDPETTQACRRVAGGLARVAPERIRTELTKLLESGEVAPALRWTAAVGVLAPALGLERSRRVQGLTRAFSVLDSLVLRRSAPERRSLLRLALIAAGLRLSPADAAVWLSARRFSREQAGRVARLLELAQRARDIRSSADAWRWVRDSRGGARDALCLVRLLHPKEDRRVRELHRRAARRRCGPRVTGSDVLAWLPISEGPAVGELLRELEVEILRGRVRTRQQARKWLSGCSFTRGLLRSR